MESRSCDVNQLDADVLLPPRKRHLAGMKRQVEAPAAGNDGVREFDAQHHELLRSYPNMSDEEIVVASRLAAFEAAKVAQLARAAAEEKAARAAKAVAAAKNAIALVSSMEEVANADKYLKKNKMKKHVEVQALYGQAKGGGSWKADEELARKLHRAINSSPRTINKSPVPESSSPKHKKPRTLGIYDRESTNNAGPVLQASPSTDSGLAGGDGQKMKSRANSESDIPMKENDSDDQLEKERVSENGDSASSQKKENMLPTEDLPPGSLSPGDANSKTDGNGSSGAPVEGSPGWKCQTFKAPTCVEQNEVMQS